MPEKLFNFGGFIIKIIFACSTGDKIPLIDSAWYRSIIAPFSVEKVDKVDFFIKFVNQMPEDKYFLKKGNSLYIKLFTQLNENTLATPFTINVSQFEIIIEKILSYLAQKHGFAFIMHASAISVNRQAYLFLGDKGSGKSTIISMLCKKFEPLCDDKCLVRKENGKLYFYQLPFVEKNNHKKKGIRLPIGKFFILKKSSRFTIQKGDGCRLKDFVLNKTDSQSILSLLEDLGESVYFFYFSDKDNFLADKLLTLL